MKTKTTKTQPPLRELSQDELEKCELEAHAYVPEDATEDEAQDAYSLALHELVEKRRRRPSDCHPEMLTRT